MYVARLVIEEVRNLTPRDDRFVDPHVEARRELGLPVAGPEVASVISFQGVNGSGKTTLLDIIASLFIWLRACAKGRRRSKPSREVLVDAGLAAIELTDVPGSWSRFWIAVGEPDRVRRLVQGDRAWDTPAGRDPFFRAEFLSWFDEQATTAESGTHGFPNLVFLDAEGRYLRRLHPKELLQSTRAPGWMMVYQCSPEARGEGHVEGQMRQLALARPEMWRSLQRYVADVRPGLVLEETFDLDTLRPVFRRGSSRLFAHELTAGEKSLLVNAVIVLRQLVPGGIVLVDEPELHLHLSLIRPSLAALHELVRRLDGQLILASHAPEVWRYVEDRGLNVDLDGRGTS